MERKDCGMLIEIYTDGSSRGNPGPGGYGIIMRAPSINHEKRIAEGFRMTTNNRMELLSVIVAIEMIKGEGHDVHIYSDSRYTEFAKFCQPSEDRYQAAPWYSNRERAFCIRKA